MSTMIRCGCPGSLPDLYARMKKYLRRTSSRYTQILICLLAAYVNNFPFVLSIGCPYRPTNQPLKYTPDCLPYKKKAFRCKNDAECSQPVNQLAANRLSPPKWCSEEYLLLRESDCLFDCVAVSLACFYQYPNCRESACPSPCKFLFPVSSISKTNNLNSHLFSTREQVYKRVCCGPIFPETSQRFTVYPDQLLLPHWLISTKQSPCCR